MKKLAYVLISLVIFFSFSLLYGCSQTQGGGGGVTKHTALAGVTLGQSLSQVESVWGAGTFVSSTSRGDLYSFGSKGGMFLAGSLVFISCLSTGYSIENITVGDTASSVLNKIGTAPTIIDVVIWNNWYYPDRNISIVISKSTDLVTSIGVYDSSKLTY